MLRSGELGGAVQYLYWSQRRTARFLEDNSIHDRQVTRTIATPAFGWLPTLSQTATSTGALRPQIAKTIEKALGQIAVSKFNAPSPIRYAKGVNDVVFGEFKTWHAKPEREPALMFASADYDRKDRQSVAICLFGSMDNFLDFVLESGPESRDGWTSSSAPAIYNFIRSHGQEIERPYGEEDIALDVLGVANGQGISGISAVLGADQPWQRGYTYGDARHAEWLAEIYLDVDLVDAFGHREDGFRRVLVGAPLWIRTPNPQAITLYASSESPVILAARQSRANARVAATTIELDWSRDPYAMPASEEVDSSAITTGPFIEIPYEVYGSLRIEFVKGCADWFIEHVRRRPRGERIVHLGDHFGRVFAWLWRDDKDQAMILLADFMTALRRGHPSASEIGPPIELDEVLRGLRPALPRRFADYDQVVTMARREVQKYFGDRLDV